MNYHFLQRINRKTSRSLETRYKEHIAFFRKNIQEKSAFADHIIGHNHVMNREKPKSEVNLEDLNFNDCVELINQCSNKNSNIDFLESFYIAKQEGNKYCLNRCKGPCESSLVELAAQIN